MGYVSFGQQNKGDPLRRRTKKFQSTVLLGYFSHRHIDLYQHGAE